MKAANKNWYILLISKNEQIFDATQKMCNDFNSIDTPSTYEAQTFNEAKSFLSKNNEYDTPLTIIDFDSIEEKECWKIVKYIRTDLDNEAIRIYISSQKTPEMNLLVKYNISEFINMLDIKKDSFITTLSASLRTYKRIIAINNTRKHLNHTSSNSEEDIAGDVKKLQKSEQRLRTILDSLMIPVFITELQNNKLRFINENSREKFCLKGIDISTFDKRNLYVDKEDHKKATEIVKKDGKMEHFETKMRALNGNEYCFLRSSKIISFHKELCELITFKDITPRKEMEEELKRLATTDALTGINNRHQLFKLGEAEMKRSKRTGKSLSVMLIDVDFFKKTNDTYGHKAGDAVLKTLSQTFMSLIREIDICGRLGGEEFVIILPETATKAALNMAKRLQAKIREASVTSGKHQIKTTVSIGLTSMLEGEKDLDMILHRADMGLYKAKETGRDKTIVYDETCEK
ncbi:MAG: GGDEF domain-containing protein [Alphaproteobacteria bacterium]|nr:GGDEF domain-containing protein [Alphaproteobacteria bacterium]